MYSVHNTDSMELKVQRSLASKEIRDAISPIKKAVLLTAKLGYPPAVVARVCNLNRSTVRRAVKAHASGREFGINGRPIKLSRVQESKLGQVIEKGIHEHCSPSRTEIAAEVCPFFCFALSRNKILTNPIFRQTKFSKMSNYKK